MPPVKPMLAKSVPEVPVGDGFVYEPKWDGFRCIAFKDGDDVELGSRGSKPLTRYFPDLVEVLRAQLPEEARKLRDRPEVGVQLFSAGFIFLLSGFTLGWEGVGAVLLALFVTALFIFRDLRPDLARALAR